MLLKIVSYILYYISWLGAVYAPRYENSTLISFVSLVPFFVFILLCLKDKIGGLKMILLISALGLTLDSLLNYSGVITFAKPETTIWPFPPPWYWPIWIGLISWLIDFSDFFSGKRLLCAVLGAIGVAFSFLAGQKLGAVTINKSIYIIAAIWFFLFPSLIELIGWSKSWNKN